MHSEWTIAIRPAAEERPRKITKIIGLKDGGFSVLTPYHKAQSGFLCKAPVEYRIVREPGEHQGRWEETVGFTVEDRAKLSYHTDGFAQFSSEKSGRIISGRDPTTGEPKGLGLITHPLDKPIWSGPSVGVTVWGIHEFEEVQEHDEVLVFEPNQFYYRSCTPAQANSWILSIYVFPKRVVPPLRFEQGHYLLDVALEGLNGPLVSVVRLSVVHLPKEEISLGLFVNRTITDFPSRSGWILSGPGDYTEGRKGYVLMGFYPRNLIPVAGRGALDRIKSPLR